MRRLHYKKIKTNCTAICKIATNHIHYHAISVAFNRNMNYTMTSPCAEQTIQGIGLESNPIHKPG